MQDRKRDEKMITEEEAITIIKNHKIVHKMNEPRAIHISEALDVAIESLENQKTGHWIPVSERLPEKEGRYLCTVGAKYRNPREMYYAPQAWANKSDNATWRGIDGSYVYDWFIKAWMPLPEPYKAESEG